MKKLYVISGATGMTGSELCRNLLADGCSVIGFDNFFCSDINVISDIIGNSALVFYEYDLNNAEQMANLEQLVAKRSPDFDEVIFINCAAVVHTEYFYEVDSTFTTNVLGMKSFLNMAIRTGAKKYINCSTSEVYSMQSYAAGGVKEDDYITLATAEHSQRTSYAVGKLMTEFFMKDAVNKGRIFGCSIRFANVYSKSELYPKHIIPHIVNSLLEDGSVTLLENSKKTSRTFLNNSDSCSAVIQLASTDAALDGSAYNVATTEEVAILDLVRIIAEKLNISEPVVQFKGFRASDPERRCLNTDKIRNAVGWAPNVTLSQGLDEVIAERTKK